MFMYQPLLSENILVKSKKVKSESIATIKENLVDDLDELLKICTKSIKHMTNLVDDIIVDVKQLAGQESGILAHADKVSLESYRQKVKKIKNMLQELELECCLK